MFPKYQLIFTIFLIMNLDFVINGNGNSRILYPDIILTTYNSGPLPNGAKRIFQKLLPCKYISYLYSFRD